MASSPLVPFKLFYGVIAEATGDATITDLPFTPDFVILQGTIQGGEVPGWSATSTTLTISKSATTASGISYIAGNFS